MAKVKAVEMMSESDAWKHINAMFGESTVFHPNQIEKVETFSTRSPALDRATQVGGWARGRIYQLAGKPSSGKTFMALVGMAEWQSRDPENCCAFIDAEYTYDPDWAASLGVDNDRVLLIKTNDGQKIFSGLVGKPVKNKTTGVVKHIEGLLGMIKAKMTMSHVVNGKKITLKLEKMGMIILDSVAAMQAPMEMESEVGKQNMAPLSRFLTVELKKLTPAVAHANVCFIAINHVKTNIGQLHGNPDTTPGGAAWKHACSVMLMVAPIGGTENVLKDVNDEKYGHKITIKVEKNKLGKPYKKAEFFIDFTAGVTQIDEQLLELGCLYGLIERPNNRTYIIDGNSLTSKELALGYILENKDRIEEQVREKYLSGETITLQGEGVSEFTENPFDLGEGDEYEELVAVEE